MNHDLQNCLPGAGTACSAGLNTSSGRLDPGESLAPRPDNKSARPISVTIEITEKEITDLMRVTNAEDIGMFYSAEQGQVRRDVIVRLLRAHDARQQEDCSLRTAEPEAASSKGYVLFWLGIACFVALLVLATCGQHWNP